MKKLLILALMACGMQTGFAMDMAKIKINIVDQTKTNRYFLCLPNVGCLSIAAGDQGKTYPVLRNFDMTGIFVLDVENNMRVSPEGLPASCNVTVNEQQTITIAGKIAPVKDGNVMLKDLHCSVA